MIANKVAAQPDLRQHGLSVSDFAWMIPDTKAYSYAPYGVEGLAHLWQACAHALADRTCGGILNDVRARLIALRGGGRACPNGLLG
eukprot:3459259-Pleurochrysis_carterae.AAC.1